MVEGPNETYSNFFSVVAKIVWFRLEVAVVMVYLTSLSYKELPSNRVSSNVYVCNNLPQKMQFSWRSDLN